MIACPAVARSRHIGRRGPATLTLPAVLLLITAVGCGPPQMGPVSGQVTFHGKPVPMAVVSFQPTNRPMGVGVTDNDGRYRLSSKARFDGAYGGLWRRSDRPPNLLCGIGFSSQGTFVGNSYRQAPAARDNTHAWVFEGVKDELFGGYGFSGGGAAGCKARDTAVTPHAASKFAPRRCAPVFWLPSSATQSLAIEI